METGWTEVDERAFAQLMQVAHLQRMPAIRLYRRCRSNFDKALAVATAEARPDKEIARRKACAEACRRRAVRLRQQIVPGTAAEGPALAVSAIAEPQGRAVGTA